MTREDAIRIAAKIAIRGFVPRARAIVAAHVPPGVVVIEVNHTVPKARPAPAVTQPIGFEHAAAADAWFTDMRGGRP